MGIHVFIKESSKSQTDPRHLLILKITFLMEIL